MVSFRSILQTMYSTLGIRIWGCLLGYWLLPPGIHGTESVLVPIPHIIQGIRDNHHRLLHVDGGIGIRYHMDVQQDPNKPVCIYHQGLDGSLNIRWPELRSREEGVMSGIIMRKKDKNVEVKMPMVREGAYNFETMAGVSHDGDYLGQIVNYRHVFSSKNADPLRWQFYVEMDQYYVPGETMKTEYWFPNAIEQHPYELAGEESIDGIPCQIIKRPGLDTIWIAIKHGFTICRREYHYGLGQPLRERVRNLDLKEVVPGIWIPLRQIKESFDLANPGVLQVRYVLKVTDVKVGNLSDADVRVVLSDKIARIEDDITGKIYEPMSDKTKPLDESISRSIRDAPPLKSRWLLSLSMLGLNIMLGSFILRITKKTVGKAVNEGSPPN